MLTFLAGSGERSGKQVVLTTRFGFIQPMIARFGEDHRAAGSTLWTLWKRGKCQRDRATDAHNAHPARK